MDAYKVVLSTSRKPQLRQEQATLWKQRAWTKEVEKAMNQLKKEEKIVSRNAAIGKSRIEVSSSAVWQRSFVQVDMPFCLPLFSCTLQE